MQSFAFQALVTIYVLNASIKGSPSHPKLKIKKKEKVSIALGMFLLDKAFLVIELLVFEGRSVVAVTAGRRKAFPGQDSPDNI